MTLRHKRYPCKTLGGSIVRSIRPPNFSPHCAAVLSPVNVAVVDIDMLWSTSRGFLLADSCCFVCLEND